MVRGVISLSIFSTRSRSPTASPIDFWAPDPVAETLQLDDELVGLLPFRECVVEVGKTTEVAKQPNAGRNILFRDPAGDEGMVCEIGDRAVFDRARRGRCDRREGPRWID